MSLSACPEINSIPAQSACDSALAWYAVYTCPRHEKWVTRQLDERCIESFVPLYHAVHQWKDRRKAVELPLFPCYAFVRFHPVDRLRVLQVPGVVHVVSFNGHPAPLPTNVIEALRTGMNQRIQMEPWEYLRAGDQVRVVSGPLIGATGVLVQFKGKLRVVITLDALMRSVAVEVGSTDIEAVHL